MGELGGIAPQSQAGVLRLAGRPGFGESRRAGAALPCRTLAPRCAVAPVSAAPPSLAACGGGAEQPAGREAQHVPPKMARHGAPQPGCGSHCGDQHSPLVASCFRGALPPVDLRAVCLVLAMASALLCAGGVGVVWLMWSWA